MAEGVLFTTYNEYNLRAFVSNNNIYIWGIESIKFGGYLFGNILYQA
jgi:hypothetical protein